jgi:RNA polymerase sigma-70 factor (ECF subfamily)
MAILSLPFPTPAEKQRLSDGHLVRQTRNGDRSAFNELFVRYQRPAVAVAYRLLGNIHDAMEVTQDAFLKAFSNLPMLQQAEAFGGWLMRIVSNLSLNFRRGRKSRSALPLDDLPDSTESISTPCADPFHRIESAEMGRVLRNALQRLPARQRTAIILFTLEQLPQKQVAETLGCSVKAVKWHVFQGRKKLRQALKDYLTASPPHSTPVRPIWRISPALRADTSAPVASSVIAASPTLLRSIPN